MKFHLTMKRKVSAIPFNAKYILLVWGCLIIHTSLLILFGIEKIYPLFILNVFSVMLYVWLIFMVRHGKVVRATLYSYVEVQLQAIAAVLLLGYGNVFELYLICVMPVLFFSSYVISRRAMITYILGTLSAVIFVVLRIYSVFEAPPYAFSSEVVEVGVYIYNCFILFAALFLFSILLIQEIQSTHDELKAKNEMLVFMNEHDSLTRLLTRGSMHSQIAQAIRKKRSEEAPFAVAFCDIDNFKRFNDTYGHDCGDYVLQNVAAVIEENVGASGTVCRWGGEEIVILFKEITKQETVRITENIRRDVETKAFYYDNQQVGVTITCGIAFGEISDSEQDIIKRADKALYCGKNEGKNRIYVIDGIS